ncbi:unnamed protein product [Clonostachys rosea]|uniref:Uncharacterized protein n=1 Tax=Bionectria ochroleuca TaxID=29856 RepID=A0ABY6UD19_BIOOC|nr:unnamed protein product [Clonostachys rosea]
MDKILKPLRETGVQIPGTSGYQLGLGFQVMPTSFMEKVGECLSPDEIKATARDLLSLSLLCKHISSDLNDRVLKHFNLEDRIPSQKSNYTPNPIDELAFKLAIKSGCKKSVEAAIRIIPGLCQLSDVTFAIETGNYDIARFLLKLENVFQKLSTGATSESPIFAAVKAGRTELVELIIEAQGLDVSIFDKSHKTVLHHACEQGHLDLVRRFVRENADPYLFGPVSEFNRVALGPFYEAVTYRTTPDTLAEMRAAMYPDAVANISPATHSSRPSTQQRPEHRRIKYEPGSYRVGVKFQGYTPLHLAITRASAEVRCDIVKEILAVKCHSPDMTHDMTHCLDLVITLNRVDILEIFIEQDILSPMRDDGSRLVYWISSAASKGAIEVFKRLVELATTEELTDCSLSSILLRVVKLEKMDIATQMAKSLVDRVRLIRNNDMRSFLNYRELKPAIIEVMKTDNVSLMDYFLSLAGRLPGGQMPWYTGTSYRGPRSSGMLQLLINFGLDVDKKFDRSNTLLQEAIAELRRQSWPLKWTREPSNGLRAMTEFVKDLASMVRNINDVDDRGRTALWSWVESHDEEPDKIMLEVNAHLLDNNANPSACDHSGDSILHFVAREGSIAMMRLLLDRGAFVMARNEDGRTPLHYTQRGGTSYSDDVTIEQLDKARLLVDYHADPEATCNDGVVALHPQTGIWKNSPEILTKLIELYTYTDQLAGKTGDIAEFLNRQTSSGKTLLTNCVYGLFYSQDDRLDVQRKFERLLELGADINTPLKLALDCRRHAPHQSYYYMQNGSNTPLYLGPEYESYDARDRRFMYILHHGANINATDRYGKTLLDLEEDKETRMFLIEMGARPSS